jgi:hypothetical protein
MRTAKATDHDRRTAQGGKRRYLRPDLCLAAVEWI